MGAIVFFAIGLCLAAAGFAVLRDPMRLAFISPRSQGYYQRIVLDTWQRIPMRLLGVLISLFGSVIACDALSGLSKLHSLQRLSEAFLLLLSVVFVASWIVGLIVMVRQIAKGRLFDWLQAWRMGLELGPIAVFPPITPKMQKEARVFTISYLAALVVAAVISVLM